MQGRMPIPDRHPSFDNPFPLKRVLHSPPGIAMATPLMEYSTMADLHRVSTSISIELQGSSLEPDQQVFLKLAPEGTIPTPGTQLLRRFTGDGIKPILCRSNELRTGLFPQVEQVALVSVHRQR